MSWLCALKSNYCWVCLYCIHAKLTSAEYVRNSCLHMKPIEAGNVQPVCTQKPNMVEYFQTVFTQNQQVLSMFGLFSRKTNKYWVCSDCFHAKPTSAEYVRTVFTQNQLVLSMSGLFSRKTISAKHVRTVYSRKTN